MKISIRESSDAETGLRNLRAYRPRERRDSLDGTACETKSGYWIVMLPQKRMDVCECEADAAFMLQNYYASK